VTVRERPEFLAGPAGWVGVRRWAAWEFREAARSARDREHPECAARFVSAAASSAAAVAVDSADALFSARWPPAVAGPVDPAAAALERAGLAVGGLGLRDFAGVAGGESVDGLGFGPVRGTPAQHFVWCSKWEMLAAPESERSQMRSGRLLSKCL